MHPDFKKNGYLISRSFFDNRTIALAQSYFDLKYRLINFSDENRATKTIIGDTIRLANSFCFYGDTLTESILLNYGQKVSELLNINLSPTYSYTRIYEKDDFLIPHLDRPSCEVSASCPITCSNNSPSKIFISNYKFDRTQDIYRNQTVVEIEARGDYTEVELYPGDALFYNGCERYHWRRPLSDDYLVQFFMHFVETNGINKDLYFDTRPYLGFPESYASNSKRR